MVLPQPLYYQDIKITPEFIQVNLTVNNLLWSYPASIFFIFTAIFLKRPLVGQFDINYFVPCSVGVPPEVSSWL